MTRIKRSFAVSLAIVIFAAALMSVTSARAQQPQSVSAEDTREIARDAYIYAYPLVLMDITRRVGTNVAEVVGLRGPMNEFAHGREFPDPSFTDVVRPNADTLYSAMYFDVSTQPLVFSVPDSGGRYYLLPMLDMWSDVFAVPGKRTTGTGAVQAIRSYSWAVAESHQNSQSKPVNNCGGSHDFPET